MIKGRIKLIGMYFKLRASIFIMIAVISCMQAATRLQKKIACYYTSWTVYRDKNQNGYLAIENIPVGICTHVIYAFIGMLDTGEVEILDSYADVSLGGFTKIVNLKNTTPNLKVYVALGGQGRGSASLSQVMSNPTKRTGAVTSITDFLNQYGFDGVDINWMYPAASDKVNFALFLTELKSKLKESYKVITVSISKDTSMIETSYDLGNLVKNAYWIGILTYDYLPPNSMVTGHNSPLFSSPDNELSVNKTISFLLSLKIPPWKLLLGGSLFAKTFKLASSTNYNLGDAVISGGTQGPYSKTTGFLDYTEVCEMNPDSRVLHFIPMASYGVKDDQWISYDTPKAKLYKGLYASSNRLGGIMVWELTNDNPRGSTTCPTKFETLKSFASGLMYCPEEAEMLINNRMY